VLRYWEQEFAQLKPVKRRGNRRYYQHHEVLLVRRIRELLYSEGFTISGARHRLEGGLVEMVEAAEAQPAPISLVQIRAELIAIRDLLEAPGASSRPATPAG
jgi:DNA-binding transcriptional MerR regulator